MYLSCKPFRPCSQSISGRKITCAHTALDIACQLTEGLCLSLDLAQFDLGQVQGTDSFAHLSCQAQTLGVLERRSPNRLRLRHISICGALSKPPKRERHTHLCLTTSCWSACQTFALAKTHGRCASKPTLTQSLVGQSARLATP
jgi:hypothetical protein